MKNTCRMLALLLALLLLTASVLAEEFDPDAVDESILMGEEAVVGLVGYTEDDALAEESAFDALDAQPGDYEWYILPSEPVDWHAYVDIYPVGDVDFNENGEWTYVFNIEECTGISFQPYVLTVICFTGDQEVRRTSYDIDTMSLWWRDNAVLQKSNVVYQGTVSDADITAVALSIIGLDEYGYEQEFHSLIDIRTFGAEGE